jgi:Uma2 family endonuclease
MSIASKLKSISVADYLAGEQSSRIKYEYVDGRIFAMAGGTNAHNRIASRVLIALGRQLSGSSCEAYNSDTKIRVRKGEQTYFYYPDATVVCQSNPDTDTFQDYPVLIVEVVSESTRRIDEGEKRDHYLSIGSLSAYVLLEQDRAAARGYFRQEDGSVVENVYDDPHAVLEFARLGVKLGLDELYEV